MYSMVEFCTTKTTLKCKLVNFLFQIERYGTLFSDWVILRIKGTSLAA
jgi:hypothetical protein